MAKPLSENEKNPLPVDVRRSKTPLLKFTERRPHRLFSHLIFRLPFVSICRYNVYDKGEWELYLASLLFTFYRINIFRSL